MKRYAYCGPCSSTFLGFNDLKGQTALGQTLASFVVQVDNFEHRWSHGWHLTDRKHWVEITHLVDL